MKFLEETLNGKMAVFDSTASNTDTGEYHGFSESRSFGFDTPAVRFSMTHAQDENRRIPRGLFASTSLSVTAMAAFAHRPIRNMSPLLDVRKIPTEIQHIS